MKYNSSQQKNSRKFTQTLHHRHQEEAEMLAYISHVQSCKEYKSIHKIKSVTN